MDHFSKFKYAAAPLALCIAMISAPSFAQDQAQDAEQASEGEAIVVTGSRIARPELDVANPITAVSSAAIERTGQTNVTNILLRTPALSASTGSSQSNVADVDAGSTGANLLNLRNLGVNRTLVLVNGKRHVAGIANSAAVDINSIPQELIERVDVLTGGASAVYGADGVSGVVNFVLKRDFEGFRATGQIGLAGKGDAASQFISMLGGKNFADGRGNITLAYEYNNTARLSSFARPFSGDPLKSFGLYPKTSGTPDSATDPARILYNNLSWSDSAPDGAISFDFVGGIPSFTGSGLPYDRGLPIPGSGGLAVGGSNTSLAGYFGDLEPSGQRNIVNGLASFEFSPAVRLSIEGKYAKTKAFSLGQPSFDFGTFLAPDNAYLINRFGTVQTQNGALFSRDNFDFGIRGERAKRETYRSVIGLDGAITDNLNYELSYVYGRTSAVSTRNSTPVNDRFFAALDAVDEGRFLTGTPNGNIVCRSTLQPGLINDVGGEATITATTFTTGANSICRPLNVLGNNVASPEALAFALTDITSRSTVEQQVVSGSVAGDFDSLFSLPGGSLGFALGAEYRKEKSRATPDLLVQNNQLRSGFTQPISGGKFDVKEVFAEINAPLLSSRPFFELLSLSAAVRLSDYSTIGRTTTWKIDGVWSPVRDIRFRGTYSQAVRAPNISELFDPLGSTFIGVDDPCDQSRLAEGTQFRVANCATILSGLGLTPAQIAAFSPSTDPLNSTDRRGLTGGNRNLTEETARSWTAGVVLQPSFVPRLTATFDWYDVQISNAVNTAEPTDLARLCVDSPTVNNGFCANIFRETGTGFVLGDISDPQSRIGFISGPQNVAFRRTKGADFAINYAVPTAKIGRFDLSLAGGYLKNISFVPITGSAVINETVNRNNPRWRGNASVNWQLDGLSVSYGVSYFSKTRRVSVEELQGNPFFSDPKFFFIKELWQHDVRITQDVGDAFTVYGGVNNIFDQQPDIDELNYPISGIGRFLYVGAKVKFGPNR
jgi:iron complex outermembrane recepter protein